MLICTSLANSPKNATLPTNFFCNVFISLVNYLVMGVLSSGNVNDNFTCLALLLFTQGHIDSQNLKS
jgi:hypothetical protein